jgi:twitching motility protein PilT
MFNIKDFLTKAAALEASDIHLHVGEAPLLRINGSILKTSLQPLTENDLEAAFTTIAPEKHKSNFYGLTDLNFVFELPKVARFRSNFSKVKGQPALVFRIIPLKIRSFEDLNMPEIMKEILKNTSGIILVTGPSGSGKSTTLASIIDWYNENYSKHILTIEEPIEYIFKAKKSLISQREVGLDTATFEDGLRYSLRQDPDIVFIGEICDRNTAEAALKAAGTGKLVLSTLQTTDAVQTIIRIINMFDKNERDNVRSQLVETLRGTIAQKLVHSKKFKKRFASMEVLPITTTVKDYIKKDNIESIYQLMGTGTGSMISMNESLLQLFKDDKITEEEALEASNIPDELNRHIRAVIYSKKIEVEKAEQAKLQKIKEAEEEKLKSEAEEKQKSSDDGFEAIKNDNFEVATQDDFEPI